MDKNEIIEYVISRVDWETLAEIRSIACKSLGYSSEYLNVSTTLKDLGRSLLTMMLEDDTLSAVESGMLRAYKTVHDEHSVEYGIYLKIEGNCGSAWVEDGQLQPWEQFEEDTVE